MHLTRINTKDGKEYRGIIEAVKVEQDKPYIQLGVGDKYKKILLFDITEAITENERVSIKKIANVNELPRWLEIYNKWVAREKK